jgi:Lipid A 3-O-deacylase (PagL)
MPASIVAVLGLLVSLLAVEGTVAEERQAFDRKSRTRGLVGGWAHSWRPFVIFGETESDIGLVAFHPRMGWFVTDRLELYGEGTLLVYHKPEIAIAAGLGGIAGRYHFKKSGRVIPYGLLGAGLVWTSLDVPEIDRIFNFQVFGGAGVRLLRDRGPGVIIELRTHHISNANTVLPNLGIDVATVLVGIEWILR